MTPEQRSEDDQPRLRPGTFAEFVGQARVVKNLQTWIDAARKSSRPLDHVLFTGPPGLGKTTLAGLVAGSVGAKLVTSSGPVLERPGDLAGILYKLGEGDVLFIDEIHRLRTHVEEYLYSAMEEFRIDVSMDEGPHARTMSIPLQRFTLIGATTRAGLLSKPFRDRFGIQERLSTYKTASLQRIVQRSAHVFGVTIEPEAALLIGSRARGTPRVANRFLARVRDVAQAQGEPRITSAIASEGLGMLGIDEAGLDEIDRRYLQLLAEGAQQPIGLKTLAVALGEEEDTIEDVYEPFLIAQSYVRKTSRGRVLGPRGYESLGLEPLTSAEPTGQSALFQ